MPPQWAGDNRIFALSLGVSVLGLFGLISYTLRSIRDAQKLQPSAPKPQYIDQKSEDALMPNTLRTLISSPNKGIGMVASRIILDRAVHDRETVEEVVREVQRRDGDARERALRALQMLVNERSLDDSYVPHIIKAVVVALKHNADEHEYDVYDQYNDTFGDRDDTERKALAILHILLVDRSGAAKVLLNQTRFIRNWLLRQPWGTTDSEKKYNFAHFVNVHKYQGHSTLSIIISKLCNYWACVQLLVEVGLLREPEDIGLVSGDYGYTRSKDGEDAGPAGRAVVSIEIPDSFAQRAREDPHAVMEIVRDALGAAAQEALRRETRGEAGTMHMALSESAVLGVATTIGANSRTIEQSEEERRLRRRNREAMVLGDGTQPVGMIDIIEGTRTGDESLE